MCLVTPASTYTRIFFINPVSTYIMTFHQYSFYLHSDFSPIQIIITQLLFIQSSLYLRYDIFINPVSTYAMTFHKSSFHVSY